MKKIITLKNIFNRHTILAFLLYLTVILTVSDIAFSVATYHDNVIASILILYFIYYIVAEYRNDKSKVQQRVKSLFKSAKWLYISIALYIVYDLITMIYTKDIYYSLQKLPYTLQFCGFSITAIYFLDSKRKATFFIASIFAAGLIVAIGSYVYYFVSDAPIYFKRLSTSRDYNTFSCLLMFSMLFGYWLMAYRLKLPFVKRILLFLASMMIIMPSFYLAGSRRMAIMLPYFLAVIVIYEIARVFIKSDISKKNAALTLLFTVVIVAAYFGSVSLLDPFTKYGEQKEKDYKQFIIDNKDNPNVKPSKKPIKPTNETTISETLETIEDKSMMSKRSLIYGVAFDELKNYSPIEFIFGNGASYDMYMYYTTDNSELLEAYSISETNPRTKSFLSVHNFMLSDLLNGGIIKLLLGIFLVIQIIRYLIKAIRNDRFSGVTLIICTFLVMANNFISGAYGMLNDVFFHIELVMIITTVAISRKESSDEENLHNDQCSSSQRCKNIS